MKLPVQIINKIIINILETQKNKVKSNKRFTFNKKQKEKINKFIKKTKIYDNFDELINFIKKSIKYREYSKFIFTKSIDLVFENIEKFGKNSIFLKRKCLCKSKQYYGIIF